MKNLFLFLFLFLSTSMLIACKKNATPTIMLNEMAGDTTVKTYTGNFVNGPYGSVSGKAHTLRDPSGSLQLQLEGFSSSNGPDLRVYLSKEIQPVNFIDLGALRSVSGTQLYMISGSPDFMEYKYALIHCRAFNHLFGSALLQRN